MTTVVLAAFSAYLLAWAVVSLRWPMSQDSPILLYAALAIDRWHLVPYRDFFDMNVPGAYWAYAVLGRLFGFDEAGMRHADLVLLALLLVLTFVVMRRFGRTVAWCAAVFFGVLYLASGSNMSLQREYLVLILMAAAVAAAVRVRTPPLVTTALIGVLAGVAATIKPHAALGLPVLVGWTHWDRRARGMPVRASRLVAAAVAGFVIPIAGVAIYLWASGALPAFGDIASRYWPLYDSIAGPRPHRIVTGLARLWYVTVQTTVLGVHPGLPLLVASVIGVRIALLRSSLGADARRVVWLLVAMAGCFVVYTAVAGKFWPYHWLPFDYFGVLLGALSLLTPRAGARIVPGAVPAAMVALTIALPWPVGPFAPRHDLSFEQVREISSFLKNRLAPGDTVQPLDWTGGAVHAMLLAGARPATRFLYDFHFYHHVSQPYIRGLRAEFLAELTRARPAVIVRVLKRAEFAGPDTSGTFDALDRFVWGEYVLAVAGDGYQIWERRRPVLGPVAARPSDDVLSFTRRDTP